jgi:hypothetical protein
MMGDWRDLSPGAQAWLPSSVRREEAPASLFAEWEAGRVVDSDLPILIPDVWVLAQSPHRALGADRWVRLFRPAGMAAGRWQEARRLRIQVPLAAGVVAAGLASSVRSGRSIRAPARKNTAPTRCPGSTAPRCAAGRSPG